ncbi:helix-turn-helix domain-containing protein [Enterococcus thailandicus]
MTVFERIKELSNGQKVSLSKVAIDLGFSENLFYRWKTTEPKARDLEKVADYFGVSVDYLLGREDKSSLAEKHGVFAFDGEPVSDEEIEFLKSVLAAKRAAENNKKK